MSGGWWLVGGGWGLVGESQRVGGYTNGSCRDSVHRRIDTDA